MSRWSFPLFFVASLLVACGGGDPPPPSPTPGDATTETAAETSPPDATPEVVVDADAADATDVQEVAPDVPPETEAAVDADDGAIDATDADALPDAATDTLLPDVDAGPPTVSIDDVSTEEGNTPTKGISFAVTLSHPSSVPITVKYATLDGTALAGSDYVAESGTVTFGPGIASVALEITMKGDSVIEPDETFSVVLSEPSGGAILKKAIGKGTILDDDTPGPTIAIADAKVVEGNTGTKTITFPVTLSFVHTKTVTVDWVTVEGTATGGTLSGDYVSGGGTLTFAPGETKKDVVVTVRGDVVDEEDETFTIKLTTPKNATLADDTAVGTIEDDDDSPTLTIDDVADFEGPSFTTKPFVFTVTLSAPSSRTITVPWATADETAAAPIDYVGASGTLVFAPFETKKTITITVNGNNVTEPDETFLVKLGAPTNAAIAKGNGRGTIKNDD